MPLDPVLTPYIPFPTLPDRIDFVAFRERDAAAVNALVAQVAEPGPQVADKQIVSIPVEDGTIDIAIYRPSLDDGLLPAHLYFHGGGWVAGTGLSPFTDIIGRERAVGGRCVAITVDYRKAPEHQYPAGLNDCQAALHWVVEHASEIGVDTSIITVGGGSAGANLAAALCIKNRDEGGPAIALQLLEVPAVDLTASLPSHRDPDLGTKYALATVDVERLVRYYLGENGDARDPYASPLFAASHADLPPAYIMSAEFDVLRDDGQAYAERLTADGVSAVSSLQLGHIHPSSGFTKVMPAARMWRDEALTVLGVINDGGSFEQAVAATR
ncbi:alpha/beta hydrolase [uncultured Microbacterium sp.]|uniref:alpha/beta hydrolase n=1 Tax=uncultured Microbacterium sp. TaxID=191216 RepID=UPI0028ED8EF1|nr:alpha/beta hydrolase [uncultured Microbacterium sp.]